MTGKYPGMVGLEYEDTTQPSGVPSTRPSGTGAERSALMLQHIKDLYDLGAIISLHDHPSNPNIDGTFVGTDQTTRTGLPIESCLTGGANRTAWLAYVDRLATFLNACVTSGGVKIPIIVRWFHEKDMTWSWWNGADRSLAYMRLWRDFIDRLRSQGVTNALFDYNYGESTDAQSIYWPGDDYVDLVTYDHYETASTTVGPAAVSSATTHYSEAQLQFTSKPWGFGEVGAINAHSDTQMWNTKLGPQIESNFPRAAYCLIWTEPYGPTSGDAYLSDLTAMVNRANCLTLDKLSGVYTG